MRKAAVSSRRCALSAILVLALAPLPARAAEPLAFVPSFAAGGRDASGQPMGGTELRSLVAHGGRLFAANGYWEAAPSSADRPGAQILVLDAPGRPWRVDHAFADLLPGGRRRHLAVSALREVTFQVDAKGRPLPGPASMLLASTWDVTGRRTVFARDDRTGDWTGTILAEGRPVPGFLPQIRAFGFHRDHVTGIDLAFAGDSTGIFAGAADPAGQIRWDEAPEFATTGLDTSAFPGLAGRLRISSFAEADGRLFAAVGQQVWVRDDGRAPGWHLLYTNPSPHYSQTGLRGLTAVTGPDGHAFLLAAVEGNAARIVRIDPASGGETTDLDLGPFLDRSWQTRVSYVIAAYNDMTPLTRPPGRDDLLIGLEAFVPPAAPRPPGHTILDVHHGLEGGAWFLIRHPTGQYELHRVTADFPAMGQALVAPRTIVESPFPGDAGALYVGGYDANGTPAHDTAWIARGVFSGVR